MEKIGSPADMLEATLPNLQSIPTANSSIVKSGFPTFSHDGKKLVYRAWDTNLSQCDNSRFDLRMLDLETRKISALTKCGIIGHSSRQVDALSSPAR